MIYEKSFGIIPLKKKQNAWHVFLIHHKNGCHWGFPKGHANPQETGLDSAKRELKEETGLQVITLLRELPLQEHYICSKEGKEVDKIVDYFISEVDGKIALQKEEIIEGDFFLLSEAKDIITYENSKNICEQVIKIIT
jgi:8-oxo-dGTP pyrophosphatase MutT (NUDIX family)